MFYLFPGSAGPLSTGAMDATRPAHGQDWHSLRKSLLVAAPRTQGRVTMFGVTFDGVGADARHTDVATDQNQERTEQQIAPHRQSTAGTIDLELVDDRPVADDTTGAQQQQTEKSLQDTHGDTHGDTPEKGAGCFPQRTRAAQAAQVDSCNWVTLRLLIALTHQRKRKNGI